MDNYIVSARKYRPSTFDSVVGQKALTATLKNAIASNKLAHAYLFCGSRGVGKTTCARIFAKTINCLSPTPDGEACNECESCRAFNEQRSYNIHELDAASNNSVEDIRQLVEQVRIPPQVGKYKVYIIDEVHMLSQSAFNAFLKTLEEPPHYAIFILATTEKHKILPTILSRCQIYDFNRITVDDIVQHLTYVAQKEGVHAEPEALNVIAVKADGGMRDALSIFDQTVSFTGGNVTYQRVLENLNVLDYEYYFRLTDLFLEKKVGDSLLLFNEILKKGFDGGHFITGLASHFRDLLVSRDASTLVLLQVGASIRQRYQEQAARCPLPFLYKAMKLCNDCDLNFKLSKNKRLLVELTLIQLSQLLEPDADVSGGHGPKEVIQPVFNKTTASAPAQQPAVQPVMHAAQPVAQTAQPIVQTAQPVVQTTAQPIAQTAQTVAQPVAQQVVQAPASVQMAGPGNKAAGKSHPLSPSEAKQDITAILQQASAAPKNAPVVKPKSLGISIKHMNEEPEAAETDPANVVTVRETKEAPKEVPVSQKELNEFWLEYARLLPNDYKAMAIKMQNSLPELMEDGVTFEVIVSNELAMKDFQDIGGNILGFLRSRLNNSKINMTVRISEENERVMAVSRVERFQVLAQKNKALMSLKKEFNLELS